MATAQNKRIPLNFRPLPSQLQPASTREITSLLKKKEEGKWQFSGTGLDPS
jgi:hypothetical protein